MVVNIQVLGIAEVMRRLRNAGKEVEGNADLGVIRAGAFIEDEVKESIKGGRPEPRSVATGRLGNSIQFNKTGKAQGIVKAKKESYPQGGVTTEDVSTFLEYGTSRIGPRRHFRNTATRNEKNAKEIIEKAIKSSKF